MKKFTIGIFEARDAAERAINRLHNELSIPTDDISYIYRNTAGEVEEVDAGKIATHTPGEGAEQGAVAGGVLGALAGIAAAAGVIPILGPLFAAGPIATALGLTGAVGTTAAGALTGAAAGGLIGALATMGVGQEHAQRYSDLVRAGDILVAAYADEDADAIAVMKDAGAIETESYALKV